MEAHSLVGVETLRVMIINSGIYGCTHTVVVRKSCDE